MALPRKLNPRFLWAAVFLALLVGNLYGRFSPKNQKPRPHDTASPALPRNTRVRLRNIESRIAESGIVSYRFVYALHAPVGGEVAACPVKPGDSVEKGERLLSLRNEELETLYEETAANLKRAREEYEHYLECVKPEKIRDADLRLQTAGRELADLERDRRHHAEFLERGMVSEQAARDVERRLELKKMNLELLKTRRENLRVEQEREERNLARRVREIEKKHEELGEKIRDLEIRSPIAGTVLSLSERIPTEYRTSSDPRVPAGELVAEIADPAGRLVRALLFEKDYSRIEPGTKVKITAGYLNGKIVRGRVCEKDPKGVPYGQYVRFPVLIDIPDTENPGLLMPQSSVECRFALDEKRGVPAIPVDYLFYENGRAYCKVLEDGQAARVFVETGVDDGEIVEIVRGLAPGDCLFK
jgi:multidrug efflux pump subunit AcrA (membrane-fusion protein)